MDNQHVFYNPDQETLESWAYIEIMGHNRVAGRISERKVGPVVMLQVDIPKPDEGFSHTEIYSPSSVFSIKPTTEEWCRKFQAARISYSVLPFVPNSQNQLTASDDNYDPEEVEDDLDNSFERNFLSEE